MSQTHQSPLEAHKKFVEDLVKQGQNNNEILNALKRKGCKTSEGSLRRALKRWNITRSPQAERPRATVNGDSAEVVSRPSPDLSNPEDIVRERGLDPEEWEFSSITVNEWDGADGSLMRQLKVHLTRKKPITLFFPARTTGKIFKPTLQKVKDKPRRIVFCGDQQAPHQNKKLHEAFCRFLKDYKPEEGVLIGDTLDFPDISRHPSNPEWDVSPQDCMDSAYALLADYRSASQNTFWKKLAGNHDERLRRAQLDRFRESYGIRRALVPGEEPEAPVLEVSHLLRLDELGIEYIKPNGDYEHMQVNLSPYLAARHGWIARKGSGASALATLEHLGFSVVVGHTHRQSLVHKTRHDIQGELQTLAACETGCMCRIEDGLGYAVSPDWQAGFATATVWEDGTFKLDLATFVNGTLLWRDRRY